VGQGRLGAMGEATPAASPAGGRALLLYGPGTRPTASTVGRPASATGRARSARGGVACRRGAFLQLAGRTTTPPVCRAGKSQARAWRRHADGPMVGVGRRNRGPGAAGAAGRRGPGPAGPPGRRWASPGGKKTPCLLTRLRALLQEDTAGDPTGRR